MISFAAGAEYIQTAGSFPEPATATVMYWFTPNSVTGDNRLVGTDTLWESRLSGTSMLHEYRQGTQPTISQVFAIGTEYHVAFTYDGTNKGAYVDAVANPLPTALTNGANGTDTALSIGTSTWNLGQGANALIEDVRVYNRVLSQKEIEQVFNGNGRDQLYDGLIHWWPLNLGPDGGTVTSEPDVVGKQNMTVVAGTPTYVKSPRTFLS